MTMFDLRTNLARQVVDDEVRQHLPDKIFDSGDPHDPARPQAPSFSKTIFAYDPLNPGSTAYRKLAEEVIALIPARAKVGPRRPPCSPR